MKKIEIKKNVYYDSVSLMLITRDVKNVNGIKDANICMGTDHNKELLGNIGLLTDDAKKCKPNDLIMAIDGEESAIEAAFLLIKESMNKKKSVSLGSQKVGSLKKAIEDNENTNMVLISVPGEFAYIEAERALNSGKHVMLFSDNISIEEEIKLKELAKNKNLLMMGPDCGTAIINGMPLCFANKVNSGRIGVVGASGTGIQEVTTLIDKMGFGITQAIGTGGRDLSKDVGGIMMTMGIDALANDPDTDVIVLISKPPHPEVADKIIKQVKQIDKKFVICFLGESRESVANITFCSTLDQTAITACKLLSGKDELDTGAYGIPDTLETGFLIDQQYLRALYTGGTLCDEAMLLAADMIEDIYSNTPVKGCEVLDDPYVSQGNTFVDLGDDTFTKGKPHPMIDPDVRNHRIVQESKDPETAVILLDFVLGYGSHVDPVGACLPFIQEAKNNNQHICFVASITGTNQDPQDMDKQSKMLEDNDVILASCNAEAAKLAISIIKEIS